SNAEVTPAMLQQRVALSAPLEHLTCARPKGTTRRSETGRKERLLSTVTLSLVLLEEHRQIHAVLLKPFRESRPDASSAKASNYLAVRIRTGTLELEELLHSDRLAFHSSDFRNR